MGHNDAIGAFMKYLPALRKYRSNVKIFSGPFHTGNFAVEPFALEHDSVGGCFGFAVKIHGKKIVVATDLVNAPSRLKPFFKDADAVVFESNHDIEMLRQSSRPDYLKRRIMERGHLSNEKSANFLVEAFESGSGFPTHLFLAHISHECNTHAKAKQAYQRIFLPFCGDRTNLHLTHRDASTEVVVV
jgi:phosphoribosyl 1,2-cyclic phosphodiesterase